MSECMDAPTHARMQALQHARDHYALCAALWEWRRCELTESMRLAALRALLQARCAR
jgi:hypothetical protein